MTDTPKPMPWPRIIRHADRFPPIKSGKRFFHYRPHPDETPRPECAVYMDDEHGRFIPEPEARRLVERIEMLENENEHFIQACRMILSNPVSEAREIAEEALGQAGKLNAALAKGEGEK